MKMPQRPPEFSNLIRQLGQSGDLDRIISSTVGSHPSPFYLPWDKLRRNPLPAPFKNHEEWWAATKILRAGLLKPVPLSDLNGRRFKFCIPDLVFEELHKIDMKAGEMIGVPEPIINPQTRDQYLVRSLMEEAITSSQLEGAATTREIAKEMIRTGRPPRDTSERMILNNYITMQRIVKLKDEPLSQDLVFEIHDLVTKQTLDDNGAAGRFRTEQEKCVVGDDSGEVYHTPPPSDQLPARMAAMCDFGNGTTPDFFIHPVVRAIILHFWLAYDHPFVDGNGRTARALFYWAMLREKYWLFEFISISNILRKAPKKYGRSFLYTETDDDNDLTYFIVAQSRIIRQAIVELHDYVDRKSEEIRQLYSCVRAMESLNHRQADLIRFALKHPCQVFSVESHRSSHNIVYETARTDLLDLKSRGLLVTKGKKGKKLLFSVPPDLAERLQNMK
jgi:Fic family protein